MSAPLHALVLCCPLTKGSPSSSSELLGREVLDARPETTSGTTRTVAAHTAPLARLLQGAPYPPSA